MYTLAMYGGRRRIRNPKRVPARPMETPAAMEKRRGLGRGRGIDIEEMTEGFGFRVIPSILEDANAPEPFLIQQLLCFEAVKILKGERVIEATSACDLGDIELAFRCKYS